MSYSTGAEVKVADGPACKITGGALGPEGLRGKIGTDMVQGITMAMAELSKVSTARKALIVVGDGNDTNNETAKTALAELKKQANKQNIQMFAIIYKSAVSSEGAVITTMIGNAKTVNSIDGIASELKAIIARMADRYYLDFPGFDEKTGVGLPWDGKDHDLVIKIDQTDLDPVTMTLTPKWAQRPASVARGHPQALGVIFLFILIGGATRKKEEPMPVMSGARRPEAPKPMAHPRP